MPQKQQSPHLSITKECCLFVSYLKRNRCYTYTGNSELKQIVITYSIIPHDPNLAIIKRDVLDRKIMQIITQWGGGTTKTKKIEQEKSGKSQH